MTSGTTWPQTTLLLGVSYPGHAGDSSDGCFFNLDTHSVGRCGLLSSVGPIVLSQSTRCREGFITAHTAVGLLSSVDPGVISKSRRVAKGFPTEVTAVGLLPSVNPAVRS